MGELIQIDGNDTVVTGAGNDLIAGGAGDDLIVTGGGNDAIYGDWNTTSQSDAWKNWSVTETINNGNYTYDIANIYTESNAGTGNDTIYAGAVDFVCLEEKLIKLEGEQHAENLEYDHARDSWLRG